ncbi:MAG: DNA-directed RNA polymerase subunit alpha [Anaerolineales bacterium]|nr:MAG: DNA-directed RNA polymerase subunit alpha [Anaerolineales bacterium]
MPTGGAALSEMNLVLPKVETEASAQGYGRFSIGPLESGYGITLGNALRRVLLASLPGAAVTSLRVSGIHHEFSSIPHVREDMTALILNVKQLRVKLFNNESARLRAEIKGEGILTAGDLECPPNVEIVNPDLPLLVADSPEAELDIELVVEAGRSYSPAEERGKLPIGEIPIDAIFSPVRRASYTVERARIGQVTDYDRLVLEVTTDGTASPHDALSEAARILVQHFTLVSGVTEEEPEAEEEEESGIPARIYETPIEELELTVRAYNCLKRAGITQVGEILEKLQKGDEEILAIRNFGQKSLDELMEKLREKGFLDELERIASLSAEDQSSAEIELAA